MFKSLDHVGLGVSNMEKSLEFYRDFLGMKVVMELADADDRIGRVIGAKGAKCKIIHLQLGECVLELFKYTNPKGSNKAKSINQYDHGLIHIGFEVDDFHNHIKQLEQRGIKLVGEPIEFRPDVWVAYFYGPDGEVCEIRQKP
jgi:catechol 2,3-dioxygenase-like lactoylglutathione lyase family enzyme